MKTTMLILPILFIIIIIGVLFSKKFVGKFFNITSKFHYAIVFSFITLLLIMTITVEWLYPNSKTNHLPPKTAIDLDSYDSPLVSGMNGETPDDSLLIAKRTHEVGDKLTIDYLSLEYGEPEIWIDRKDINDGIIEEHIYKPLFIVAEYDLSDVAYTTLPEWQGDTVTFLEQPAYKLEFVTFSNSNLLDQFTDELHDSEGFSRGFSSTSGASAVHLTVPKDLKIDGDLDYINFIEDED